MEVQAESPSIPGLSWEGMAREVYILYHPYKFSVKRFQYFVFTCIFFFCDGTRSYVVIQVGNITVEPFFF